MKEYNILNRTWALINTIKFDQAKGHGSMQAVVDADLCIQTDKSVWLCARQQTISTV